MSASKPAVPEPTEIDGRYVVEKKLGAGAFGTVYKAKDKELGRLVAIKTIRLEGLAASHLVARGPPQALQAGGQGRGQPQAPQHRRLYDWKSTEGFSYLSMEFVDGVGLDRVIAGVREDVDRARGGDRRPGGGRSRLRAQERRRPPRHQAREHHDRARGPREGHRLRHREDDRPGGRAPHGDREPPRDAVLHEPGAGPREARSTAAATSSRSAASSTRCWPARRRSAASRSPPSSSRSSPRSLPPCASSTRRCRTRCCASSARPSRSRRRPATRPAVSSPTTCWR